MNTYNDNDDLANLNKWKKEGDVNALGNLLVRFQPIVHSAVNRFKTVGVQPATLRATASTQLLKSLKSYDPKKNAALSTHVWNGMMKLQRLATQSLSSGHLPEYRNLKLSSYRIMKDNLTDQLGRDPSISELASEMAWSENEVGRMESELGGETTASSASFSFYGNDKMGESKDKILVDYLYHEIPEGNDRVIFEHTFGYGGKKILNNEQIAAKLKTNPMAIHRAKNRLAQKIRDYR